MCVCVSFSVLSSSASLLACGIHQASSQIYIARIHSSEWKDIRAHWPSRTPLKMFRNTAGTGGANDTEENLIISYNARLIPGGMGPCTAAGESVSVRGTLRIRGSQLNDTGNYTVRVDTISDTQRATGWLEILGELAAAPPPNCS